MRRHHDLRNAGDYRQGLSHFGLGVGVKKSFRLFEEDKERLGDVFSFSDPRRLCAQEAQVKSTLHALTTPVVRVFVVLL